MAVHHQMEIRPVYEMTMGNKPNLKPSEDSNSDGAKDDTKKDTNTCRVESGHYVCRRVTMTELAEMLSALALEGTALSLATNNDVDYLIDRPVVNMTNLSGSFDFTLDYGRIVMGGRGEPGAAPPDPPRRLRDAIAALGLKDGTGEAPV